MANINMKDHARRNLGSGLGLVMGLAYGVVAQYINPVLLPKIPLYQPFPGRIAAIILSALCGVLVGRLAAWSPKANLSMMVSATAGALLSTLISLFIVAGGAHNQAGALRVIFLYFLPRGVVFFGVAWLIRWAMRIWEGELKTINFSTTKMALPVLALLIVALTCGLLSIYSKNGRFALNKTRELVETGLLAGSYSQLPPVLLPVDGFLERAKGKYTMQLSDNPSALPIQFPISAEGNRGHAVLVRFENGFRFGCVYIASNPDPACGEY